MAPRISLVVSDVDGTLVTPDKRLTNRSAQAVAKLAAQGIKFTITSSRPPFGVRMLIAPLALKLPIGAFNGGCVVDPALNVIERHFIPEDAARKAIDLFEARGIDVWLFTADAWLLRDGDGANVERERNTVQASPVIVESYAADMGRAIKIVGVSNDFDQLAQCEGEVRAVLGSSASASRSQRYYLDVTPPGIDKGTFVAGVAARLSIPREEIVVIGDMDNDLPMFATSGLSIAMGNAQNHVKAQANYSTTSNADDGFADAIERFVLPATAPNTSKFKDDGLNS
ncbi:MAG: Cof-type HAD-IIB family hydrolase [Variibacter sp.]